MRYVLQTATMACDIFEFLVIALVLYLDPTNPLLWFVIFLVLRQHRATGGFEAWRPSTVRQFMRHARTVGL